MQHEWNENWQTVFPPALLALLPIAAGFASRECLAIPNNPNSSTEPDDWGRSVLLWYSCDQICLSHWYSRFLSRTSWVRNMIPVSAVWNRMPIDVKGSPSWNLLTNWIRKSYNLSCGWKIRKPILSVFIRDLENTVNDISGFITNTPSSFWSPQYCNRFDKSHTKTLGLPFGNQSSASQRVFNTNWPQFLDIVQRKIGRITKEQTERNEFL